MIKIYKNEYYYLPYKYKLKKCPDNYVGNLIIKNNALLTSSLWFCCNLRQQNQNLLTVGSDVLSNDKKNMIIILESPHIDEFNKNKYKIAPAPALGITGCYLDKYFTDLLNSNIVKLGIPNKEYNVFLINAIQYQCSLGVDTDIYRDRVWLDLWFNYQFGNKLKNRLIQYNPYIIINFCTKGSHKKDHLLPSSIIDEKFLNSIYPNNTIKNSITLRELVKKVVKQNFPTVLYYEGNHPSCWYNHNYIKLDK